MINSLAARFSRKCATEDVPGINRMLGARCNSHAMATHRGEASSCAATRVRVADCKGEKPPIGPRFQRFATAASPAYLAARGRPEPPRDLLNHACLRGKFPSGNLPPWEYERKGETVRVDPSGPLIVRIGGAFDLTVQAAIDGLGVVHLFEDWLRPHLDSGALEPILEPWWQRFTGPYLYYHGHRYLPSPLRAFIDFINAGRDAN